MTAPAQTTAVRLDEVTLDGWAWPRDQLDEERVQLFAELIRDAHDAAASSRSGWTDPLPPLILVADGQGGYVLADGRHRYEARRRLGTGFDLAQAHVFLPDCRPPADLAYELALHFATISAKPLTSAEKRSAIVRLIAQRPELSDRAVARLVGVSHATVGKYRAGVVNLTTDPNTPEEADDTERTHPSSRTPLRWEVAAEQLAEGVAELLDSCRKLFGGGPNFKTAGRELYDALADLYGDLYALEVIDDLDAVVINARARAEMVK
jgi:hypothetical protein